MPAHKRTEDTHLPNGSIIYWSRRQDPNVPVRCGSCGRERMMELSNIRRATFLGLCRSCVTGESWQDETLPNGSIVFWSRRDKQRVPIQCGICGDERSVHATSIYRTGFTGFCRSCGHTGPLSTTWRGGRTIKRGYIYLKVDTDHRFYEAMANSQGYILEHRLVMAEHLGRPLESNEIVHHKNGDKADNHLKNLELFTSSHEHGRALQQQQPHQGYESAETLRQTFLDRLKSLFDSDKP